MDLFEKVKTAIVSRGKTDIESREEKGCVKIWELDRHNSDVYSGTSVEFDTDESSDSLRSTGVLSTNICFASLSLFSPPEPL